MITAISFNTWYPLPVKRCFTSSYDSIIILSKNIHEQKAKEILMGVYAVSTTWKRAKHRLRCIFFQLRSQTTTYLRRPSQEGQGGPGSSWWYLASRLRHGQCKQTQVCVMHSGLDRLCLMMGLDRLCLCLMGLQKLSWCLTGGFKSFLITTNCLWVPRPVAIMLVLVCLSHVL